MLVLFFEDMLTYLISPLRPLTCQSVRMDFLAVTPGVHTIDTLTLTDIVSGFTMNLRLVSKFSGVESKADYSM